MDEAVDLLIKRMDSNPEEFCENWDPEDDNTIYASDYRAPKWQRVIYQLRSRVGDDNAARVPSYQTKPLPFLSDEQIERLYAKYVEVQANEFEKYVLRTLLHAEDTVRYQSSGREILRIKADGSIAGVGTTSPSTALTANAMLQPGEWKECP